MSGTQDSTRWTTLAQDRHGHAVPALRWGAAQPLAFTAVGSTPSAGFAATTSVLRLLADQDCWVAIGPAAVAAAGVSTRLLAGQREYVAIRAGDLVAACGVLVSGSLNITEC